MNWHGDKHKNGKAHPVLVARHALPRYLAEKLDDIKKAPPGHRFLLYFKGAACKVEKFAKNKQEADNWARGQEAVKLDPGHIKIIEDWTPLSERKRTALSAVAEKDRASKELLSAIASRNDSLIGRCDPESVFRLSLRLSSPLATGLGNPHPVENGFAFLNPYGVPYISGSAVKGVVRRAAEELALFDARSGWSVPLVWLLFGFEEKSAYLEDKNSEWFGKFREWAGQRAKNDSHLKVFIDKISDQLDEKYRQQFKDDPPAFLEKLFEDENKARALRRSIHFKGLLRFWDALPSDDFRLGVDIMNPHHRGYFEGDNNPHDSESPNPVFFLVVESGTEFNFVVQLDRQEPRIDNWQKLVQRAFDHAVNELGFGAKTSVGYGVFSNERRGQAGASGSGRDESSKGDRSKGGARDQLLVELEALSMKNFVGQINNFVERLSGKSQKVLEEFREIVKKKLGELEKKQRKKLKEKTWYKKLFGDSHES